MAIGITYGLTRGKGETDNLLRSFSYSTAESGEYGEVTG